jgi:hypothetical protein
MKAANLSAPMKISAPESPLESIPRLLPARPGAARLVTTLSVSISLLLLLAAATELLSIAALSFIQRKPAAINHSYYQNQPWSKDFLKEVALASPKRYSPYIVWRRPPFEGRYVNIERDGLRRTVNPDCSTAAPQIWTFGSSTLWGTGATDDQTVPSMLSREYSRSIGPVCVTNFGEAGWVSTQNVIQLELALKRAPRPPDWVVFDDGFADVFVVYESGRADVHMDFDAIRYLMEAGYRNSSFSYLRETGTYRLITAVMNHVAQLKAGSAPTSQPSRNLEWLAEMTVENYLENMKLVAALSAGYGFRYAAFWGPALYVGKKPLSQPERSILESARPHLPELCRKTYALMFSVSHPHIIDISDTFDHTPDDTYLDESHVTPDGNRMVALRILEVIKKRPGERALTQ